jgi:hypothetical protein
MNTNRITKHLRYSNVIASLALFVALGGASYAAATLPANSVGAKQLQKKAVTGSKLRANAVSSGKVKDGSLLSADFKAGQVPAGQPGPQGPRGLAGATGATGETGPPGPVKVVYRKGTSNSIPANSTLGFGTSCPVSAPNVVGGGFDVSPATENARAVISHPTDGIDPDGIPDDNWEVQVRNAGPGAVTVTTYAVCTTASAVEQAPDEL